MENGDAGVRIGRADTPEIDREIARRELDLAALDRPEGYLIGVDTGGALVAAKTERAGGSKILRIVASTGWIGTTK